MIVKPFGELQFHEKDKEWSGQVGNISPEDKVELSICVDSYRDDLSDKIASIRKFASDYRAVIEKLYMLAYIKYQNTPWEKPLDEIKKMYLLAAVTLKSDNKTWWLVLEPALDTASIYNQLLRFTMIDNEIVWANFDIKTVT